MAELNEIMAERDPALGSENQVQEGQTQESGAHPPAEPQPGQEPGAQPSPDGKPPSGFVPIQALDSVRGENRELKGTVDQLMRQVQQLTGFVAGAVKPPEQAKSPDWFDDPNAAFADRMKGAVEPLQGAIAQQREAFSQMMAVEKFGGETVSNAYQALAQRVQSNPAANRWLYERIMNSPHPYGELVRWFKSEQTLSRVGDDPDAYFANEYQRRFGRPLEQDANGGGTPNGQPPPPAQGQPMPSNFAAGARTAGPRTQPQWQGPKPLSEIMPR
jgi:hypothetical protein